MKKLLFVLILTLNISCIDENEMFTGYVVRKEYTPSGYCHDNRSTIYEATFVPRVVVVPHTNTHRHEFEKETYVFYIANDLEIIKKYVTKKIYYNYKLGQKIKIKKY